MREEQSVSPEHPAEPPAERAAPAAVLEWLGDDGRATHTTTVPHWPLSLGRALDNDVVVPDAHVAAHHAVLSWAGGAPRLEVLPSINGVQWQDGKARKTLASGTQQEWPVDGTGVEISLGRTRLRMRWAGLALAPELALAPTAPMGLGLGATLAALALLAVVQLFGVWLGTDPDNWWRQLGTTAVGLPVVTGIWCGAWALLSKLFARHARFTWHLRVFALAGLAWEAWWLLSNLLAFSLSLPALASFAFLGTHAIVAWAFWQHLRGVVDAARPRLLGGLVAVGLVAFVGYTFWQHDEDTGRLGSQLYMSSFFPPSWRLASPQDPEPFVAELAPLEAKLAAKAKEPERGAQAGLNDDDD